MNTEDLHRNMIAFGEWLGNNYMNSLEQGKLIWYKISDANEPEYTTTELFDIYLKQLNDAV